MAKLAGLVSWTDSHQTMLLADFIIQLQDDLASTEPVDEVIEWMEDSRWIEVWKEEGEEDYMISIYEDTSSEGE